MKISNETLLSLYEIAVKASQFSYSPYSSFPVGAAVLFENEKIYSGCNIENRSYGLTNCAERTAVFKGISEGMKKISAVAIATPKSEYPVGPCGACRQVLTEFGASDVPVIFGSSKENTIVKTLGELYPFDSLHELAENSNK